MKKIVSAIVLLLITTFTVALVSADSPPQARNMQTYAYQTGFESSDGFSMAICDGQAGWTMNLNSLVEGRIDNATPNTGAQHLRIVKDSLHSVGWTTGCNSPSSGAAAPGSSRMQVDVMISATGGANYYIIAKEVTTSVFVGRATFSSNGNILIYDEIDSQSQFVDTGADWVAGQYKTFEMRADPAADTLDYFYDGALIYASPNGVLDAQNIEQVLISSNNSQQGESGNFDNLSFSNGNAPLAVSLSSIKTQNSEPSMLLPSIAVIAAMFTVAFFFLLLADAAHFKESAKS